MNSDIMFPKKKIFICELCNSIQLDIHNYINVLSLKHCCSCNYFYYDFHCCKCKISLIGYKITKCFKCK